MHAEEASAGERHYQRGALRRQQEARRCCPAAALTSPTSLAHPGAVDRRVEHWVWDPAGERHARQAAVVGRQQQRVGAAAGEGEEGERRGRTRGLRGGGARAESEARGACRLGSMHTEQEALFSQHAAPHKRRACRYSRVPKVPPAGIAAQKPSPSSPVAPPAPLRLDALPCCSCVEAGRMEAPLEWGACSGRSGGSSSAGRGGSAPSLTSGRGAQVWPAAQLSSGRSDGVMRHSMPERPGAVRLSAAAALHELTAGGCSH